MLLALGVVKIKEGADNDHLGTLNYGLLILTILVLCRFFDTELSFVLRGLMFLIVGVGFFAANYKFLAKRKKNGH